MSNDNIIGYLQIGKFEDALIGILRDGTQQLQCGSGGSWKLPERFLCRSVRAVVESAVTVENILSVHCEHTVERMVSQPSVLLVQDGTDLNFATRLARVWV